jgi:type IV pilus assembly protein PilW
VQGELGSGLDCSDAKAGSSFIAVRRASTCAVGDAGCAPASANFHIQVSSCQSESPGVVGLAADTGALDVTQRDCSTLAPIYRLLSRVYYVNDADVLSRAELSGGDYSSVTSLVEGIELVRFEYGLDTSGDGQVDVFTITPVGTQWADVTAVKVSLVARNIQPTLGYVDAKTYIVGGAGYVVPAGLQRHKRQVYSTTVHLRNVAGRREVP